jgi:hypothetical protein
MRCRFGEIAQTPMPLLLGGGIGVWRSYSSGDHHHRVIREASDEEEDETFLRTINFRAAPETVAAPPGGEDGRSPRLPCGGACIL